MILAAAAAGEVISIRPKSHIYHSYSPAAAAGSRAGFFPESPDGLSKALLTGLLLRLESAGLAGGGDLERLSNLEARFGSGSFWSKRERFAVLRSVSSIVNVKKTVRYLC